MNNEKVKEIKKALEVYGKENKGITILRGGEIQAIPYTDILTLINELESENERLKISEFESCQELDNCSYQIHSLEDRIAELEKENGELKQHITEVEKGVINIARERNKKEELASKFIDSYNDSLKQFAERLKEKCNDKNAFICSNSITATEIDETLKEFINERN